jgi:hypothetical protein
MLAIPKREADPTSPYWNPRSAYLRIREHIKEFKTPQAVLASKRCLKRGGPIWFAAQTNG